MPKAEWRRMDRRVQALVEWLATPPDQRTKALEEELKRVPHGAAQCAALISPYGRVPGSTPIRARLGNSSR